MTAHDAIAERLSDYLDGDLDPAAHAEVDVHLALCVDCRQLLGELRSSMISCIN